MVDLPSLNVAITRLSALSVNSGISAFFMVSVLPKSPVEHQNNQKGDDAVEEGFVGGHLSVLRSLMGITACRGCCASGSVVGHQPVSGRLAAVYRF